MNTSWSLGVLVGLPVLFIVVLGLGIFGVFAWHKRRDADDIDAPVWTVLALGAWVTAIVVIGVALTPLGYYPYSAEYHQWRPVSGQVDDVSKRLVPAGDKAMEEKVVVRVGQQAYGCTDTRCALIKKGDAINLKCKRSWQYASVSGYDCRFVSRGAS